MKQRRPEPTEHNAYFSRYTNLVPETDIIGVLERQSSEIQSMLEKVDESRADYRYAPGKWSIKQVVGHIEDSERVFAYRALSIARGGTTPLPGFDENTWMENAPFQSTSLVYRVESLLLVRQTTLALLRDLDDEAWERRGVANENPISVRAIAFVTAGHARHHMNILRERYAIAT